MDNFENVNAFEREIERHERMDRPHYFEDHRRGHDYIVRCNDCQKIVDYKTLTKLGMCDGCGCRRVKQINLLKQEEWDKIVSGEIDFEDRELFMAEFAPVPGS